MGVARYYIIAVILSTLSCNANHWAKLLQTCGGVMGNLLCEVMTRGITKFFPRGRYVKIGVTYPQHRVNIELL